MANVVLLNTSKLEYNFRFVESVGKEFIKYLLQITYEDSFGLDEVSGEETLSEIFLDEEDDYVYLKSLDPKEWKSQDHYAVLGLRNKRHLATFAEIKAAYRHKVLKHHPDKRKAKGETINRDDDYFTCITKAWETLGDEVKRKSYDSVDPYFDNEVPSTSDNSKNNFFKVFGKAFELNSRWSDKKPVPLLGKPDDPREHIDKFYAFWYSFESWREFSYEDEESKERAQDRDERKWIEKQNKIVRAKKKKEEMTRIRNLVDTAYNLDPRIARFKLEDKLKKEAQKKAKAEAMRARQEELEKAQQIEEEKQRKEKEEAEAAEKAKQNALKAERELQKRLLRKEKKTLREICKDNSYFTSSEEEAIINMEYMEKMCDAFGPKELEEFNEELKQEGREAFYKKMKELENKLEKERQTFIYSANQKQDINGHDNSNLKPWTQSHINLLIKAVNLFPAGTNQRWEVVANFINQHSKSGSCLRSAKEVLSKAKDLQSNEDFNHQLKKAANVKAYEFFQNDKKPSGVEEVQTSERFESVAEQLGMGTPWTAEEQKLLEQALKTFPSSTPDRWDQIAACIPSRTKKDCMKRYKELVEMVKAKKAAEKNVKSKH